MPRAEGLEKQIAFNITCKEKLRVLPGDRKIYLVTAKFPAVKLLPGRLPLKIFSPRLGLGIGLGLGSGAIFREGSNLPEGQFS